MRLVRGVCRAERDVRLRGRGTESNDDPVMFSSLETLIGVYGYAMQIYCDFSGYTDIAIGSALLLGYKLPDNFNRPYKADSLQNFWRRWHISHRFSRRSPCSATGIRAPLNARRGPRACVRGCMW